GQTVYNATGRMQGHLDTQLSDEGVRQAESAGRLLEDQGITRIIASDLSRARVAAEIVVERVGLYVPAEERMRETELGGRGGESRVEVAQRARPVIDELMREYMEWDDNTVLVVAHGGAIAALTCHLIALHSNQYQLLSGLKNTHWAQLTARPAFDPQQPHAP